MAQRRFDRRRREPQQRVNHRIRVPEIRVIGAEGEMLGVMPTHEALRTARDLGLDLVEINPKANPPVCKILDYGKHKYDEQRKKRETKRKQSTVEVKEIKLRPKTDDHDLDFKARAARRFIEEGNKVKFTVRFRGREITHPQKAREQLIWIQKQCEELANTEVRPTMEGRTMTMIMSPKPAVLQARANLRLSVEKERREAEALRLSNKGKRKNIEVPEHRPGKSPAEKAAKEAEGRARAKAKAEADVKAADGKTNDKKKPNDKKPATKTAASKKKPEAKATT